MQLKIKVIIIKIIKIKQKTRNSVIVHHLHYNGMLHDHDEVFFWLKILTISKSIICLISNYFRGLITIYFRSVFFVNLLILHGSFIMIFLNSFKVKTLNLRVIKHFSKIFKIIVRYFDKSYKKLCEKRVGHERRITVIKIMN